MGHIAYDAIRMKCPESQVHRARRQSSGRTPKTLVPLYSSGPTGAFPPVPPPQLLRPASVPAPSLLSLCPSFQWFSSLSKLFLYCCCCCQLLLLLLPQTWVFNMDPSPLVLLHSPETPTSAHHLMGVSGLRTSEACSSCRPPSPETPASVSTS